LYFEDPQEKGKKGQKWKGPVRKIAPANFPISKTNTYCLLERRETADKGAERGLITERGEEKGVRKVKEGRIHVGELTRKSEPEEKHGESSLAAFSG